MIPPVPIVVCDNTEIAEVFFRQISGEHEEDIVTAEEVEEVLVGDEVKPAKKGAKKKTRTVFGSGRVFPEYFQNAPGAKRTVRIDTKMLAEAESGDPNKRRQDLAEELRRVIATVGRAGQPGEQVRCVVSVAMLTEGWDASNVTHMLGVRAFGSQLLCEQVVGRGLRRMDYTPEKDAGGRELLRPEYVDVYGIPFSVVPYKGRRTQAPAPEDKPTQHVRALPERAALELRFPVVEGYAFALKRNLIRCDVGAMQPLRLEPNREPTATFLRQTVGYAEGPAAAQTSQFEFVEQSREAYSAQTHLQTIEFRVAQMVIEELIGASVPGGDAKARVLRLQSRHQLFPQVFGFVREYVSRKVDWQGCPPAELGLEKYVRLLVERLRDAILPDETQGETALLPVLNRYQPIGTTAAVDFPTTRPCWTTTKSHLNLVVADTQAWEQSAAFHLEKSEAVAAYVRNDRLGLVIPYDFMNVAHSYEPDFIVRLRNGVQVVLEIKGFEDNETKAKHDAAHRWVAAVNAWGGLGRWAFHVCRDPALLGLEIGWMAGDSGMGKVISLGSGESNNPRHIALKLGDSPRVLLSAKWRRLRSRWTIPPSLAGCIASGMAHTACPRLPASR
jgi:type III restriction enzyme